MVGADARSHMIHFQHVHDTLHQEKKGRSKIILLPPKDFQLPYKKHPSNAKSLCSTSGSFNILTLDELLHQFPKVKPPIASLDGTQHLLECRHAARDHQPLTLLEPELVGRLLQQHFEERVREEARGHHEPPVLVSHVDREEAVGRLRGRGRLFLSLAEQELVVRRLLTVCPAALRLGLLC
ncbi:hypothetical protein EUGRSUZ_A02650 [Eucalyptus grandis]|uniref:Uncharacterized protein n=2 Tax=Eucalyptus grandis TaxID=71139 RepID=A0ACC3M887_EUCGR|nr:hypothetical protein EUGRSUZ_A02650 [Eucalyptus grandis]